LKIILLRLTSLIFVSIIVSACAAPRSQITSNKAENYSTEPKRIFVVTDVGSDFGKDFADSFQSKLITIARGCGADVEVSTISTLELDNNVHSKKLKNFGADTVMTVKRNGGTRTNGVLNHVIYNVKITDIQNKKTVWRANVNFHRGGSFVVSTAERGQALAVDIINKMIEDKIFNSCPPITVSPNP